MPKRFLISLTYLLISSVPLHAQHCSFLFRDSNPLQAQAKAVIENGHYVTERSFYEYMNAFGNSFTNDLFALGEKDVWVDLGAGTGRALKDYSEYKKNRKEKAPHMIGISTQNSSYNTVEKSVTWLGGRLWEDIPRNELPPRIDRATDFYGILSYSAHVSEYLTALFLRMPVGGKFYTFLSDRDVIVTSPKKISRLFQSKKLASYLKENPNLQVEEKVYWDFLAMQKMRALTVTKLGEVQFPDLELIDYKEGSPPYRTFIIK